MPELCVNIDHVATVRQAWRTHEPDPAQAAVEAEAGGADGITVHLREDRRHIQDADLPRIAAVVRTRLNLEMAATDEMVAIAIATRPQIVMLVPEGRHEVTTEGGLDVAGGADRLRGGDHWFLTPVQQCMEFLDRKLNHWACSLGFVEILGSGVL